jgi:tetratricopeptide (TPR) repeat protein
MVAFRLAPVMIALTVTAMGCSQLPHEAKSMLEKGQQLHDAGRYDESVKTLDRFLASYGSGPGAPEAHYIRGLSLIELDQLRRGRKDLEQALAASKWPDLTANVHASMGGLDWRQGEMASALGHYRQALAGLEDEPPKDIVLYRLALGLQRQGQWSQARRYFAEVIDGYPESKVRRAARFRFSWTRKFFTIQAGAFSERKHAQKQADRLQKAGLPARQRADTRSGRPLYVVHVGQYDTYAAAQDRLPAVRRVAGEAMIVP